MDSSFRNAIGSQVLAPRLHGGRLLRGVIAAGLLAWATLATFSHAAEVTPLLTQPLPEALANQEVVMLTVEYAPGEASTAHRHNAHTFVYVLEGEVGMQVAGGEEVVLTAGGTFFEYPFDVHVVSKNNSNSAPAKFLVFFIKDIGAPTTVPAP